MEMAELESVNTTTTVTPTTTKASDLSVLEKTAIVGAVIAALTLCGLLLGLYLTHCRKRRGNGHERASTEERNELNPSSPVTDVLILLVRCQQQLISYYQDRTSAIPAHPMDPSRKVDIDKFFSELQLTQEEEGIKKMHEPTRLQDETRNLDKPITKPLHSWEDIFKAADGKLSVLLSGGAGFGKSTLLLRIANACTDPQSVMAKFKLVFLVSLREMQQTSCILEAIHDQILPNIDKTDLKKLINENEEDTAFLLDGLDEIPSSVLNSPAPEGGYGIKDILHNKVLKRSTVLVSTRPHMVGFATDGYPNYARFQILGFTFKTAKKYITSYFAEIDATDQGESLISHVEVSSLLRTLAHIPIIVLFLCIVWGNQSKLPDTLTQLYKQFAETLVRRRCNNKEEDPVWLMNSVVRELGKVALKGLLDPKGERLVFSSEEFEEKHLKDGRRLGFLQQETLTSGLTEVKVVTFLRKSIQEYCAAYYFANLHNAAEDEFHQQLNQINPDNVCALEYLLRFACGISSNSPATGLILEHIQQQRKEGRWRDEVTLQKLVRLLLFESGSDEMADKLDRPTEVECDGQEDLLAMHYYLQCLPRVELTCKYFMVHCRSHEDLVLLRGITGLLRDNINVILRFRATCRSHEGLEKLKQLLLSGYIRPMTGVVAVKPYRVTYVMSEQAEREIYIIQETLEQIDGRIRDQLQLQLEINEMSPIDDDYVLKSLSRICDHIEGVTLRNRARHEEVIRLANAFDGCNKLEDVNLSDTNLHGNLVGLDSLVTQSLTSLEISSCGLNDEDVPDLISILPAGHRLSWLIVPGNAFSVDGVQTLTAHLSNLPRLRAFWLDYEGPDAERVKQVAKQKLPNVRYV